jgi:pimeloyl-ACP methyl ester carboxylesterase
MRSLVVAVAATAVVGGGVVGGVAGSASAATPSTGQHAKPTVVLVHGAWADSSSWDAVVRRLLNRGYPVDVFPTPLQSLSGDTGALRRYLAAIPGPIVLVGHSYGGAVVSDAATGNAHVKALVYIDAFAPAQGQAVITLPGPDSAIADPSVFNLVPNAPPTPTTELYVKRDVFVRAFGNDLPARQSVVLAVTQRPVTLGALSAPSTAPAWATIPSWYEVGTIDKVIPPSAQLAMAKQAHAHISWAHTGHLPMISDPAAVTTTVVHAAEATT